jgi:urate oxidase
MDGVHAVFVERTDATYDVTLDINSHKFLVTVATVSDAIESFEIVVAKTFVDVTKRVVTLLKNLVQTLWNKLSLYTV